MLYCHRYVQRKKDFTSSVILFSFAPYKAFCLVKTSVDCNIVHEALVINKYSVFSYFSNKAILLNTSARVRFLCCDKRRKNQSSCICNFSLPPANKTVCSAGLMAESTAVTPGKHLYCFVCKGKLTGLLLVK